MKSDRAVLTFSAFALLSVATAVTSITLPKNDSSAMKGPLRYSYRYDNQYDDRNLIKFLYTALLCEGYQCPSWACRDDSAVIHGHCCGCPNPLKVDVPPVLCVEDLACPYKMDDLCEAYHFMTTCCCSSPWKFDNKLNLARAIE